VVCEQYIALGRNPRMKRRERNLLVMAGVVAATLIYIYPLFLPTPLLEPDEGLHATISQEMLENNEWIVPTFRGEPFLDKPILYFWAQMVSLKTFGMTEPAVRLPGLMFGLLGSLTTGFVATRLFGSRPGLLAWLVSMTMIIPVALAQAAVHDVALVPWTTLAVLCLWETERATDRRRQFVWLTGAALMLGLAILTKALIGVAVIGVGYGFFLILSRQLSIGSCARLAVAITAGAVLASPWFIAMEYRIDGYLYYYFVERHVMGFATASQQHGHQSWYYYAPYITLGAAPWIWYVIPLLRDEWHNRNTGSTVRVQLLFVLCWLIGGLLFLSVAKSKLATYALPLFPAISILCAFSWHRYTDRRMSETSARWFLNMLRVAAVLGIIIPVGILVVLQLILDTSWPHMAWLLATVLSVESLVAWITFERQQFNSSAGLLTVWVAGVACLVMTWPLQKFAEDYSERNLAEWINLHDFVPEHLILVGEKPASLLFYLRKDLRAQLRPDQVTSMEVKDIPLRVDQCDGVVLAVTNKKVIAADMDQLAVPGVYFGTAGQFQLFQCDDCDDRFTQLPHGPEH
jgi:4-amino-4-deoxy-L-arabinose transferase-like glycosyltransferase